MPTLDLDKVRRLKLERPAKDGRHPRVDGVAGDHAPAPPRRAAWLVLPLIVAAVVVLSWWRLQPRPATPGQTPHPPAASAAPAAAVPGLALTSPAATAGVFTAAGYVEPEPPFPVGVTPLVAGRLESFPPLEGSVVREGEEIARLDDSLWQRQAAELRAAREVNRARIAQSERTAQRTERLAGIGSASVRELEGARGDLAVLRAEAARLEEELKTAAWRIAQTRVRAPAGGVLFERLARVGEYVGPEGRGREGSAIATIYDPAKVQVWVDVNQRDAARLAVGQPAEVTLDSEPGKTYAGRVRRILPRASLSKNTVQAKIELAEPSASLRPDMSVKVSFFPAAPGNPAPAAR